MKILNVVGFVVLLLSAGHLGAHQQQEAMTTIAFNARSGNLEVMHRFYVHDAEHVMQSISAAHNDIIASERAQALFADYVAEHVALRLNQDNPIELQLLGQEFDGKFIWVYQEAPLPQAYSNAEPFSLSVKHTALLEFWPEQKNIVNIDYRGDISTLVFDRDSDWQSQRLR